MNLKMKNILFIFCFFVLPMATAPAEELKLNGGKLVPVDLVQVESSVEDMNFCFAYRFTDGTIHLNHSKGVHTVNERGCYEYSPDNGKSWSKPPWKVSFGFNAFENRQNQKCQISCWGKNVSKIHQLKISILDEAVNTIKVTEQKLVLPYSTQCFIHRDVLRTRDGRLLATAYGHKQGATKYHAMMLESTDDGKNWHYLSTIAEDQEGTTSEGPCEATIIELVSGEILVPLRTGGTPMLQYSSMDGGKSWRGPVVIAPFGVSPNGRVLSDGTIIIVSGRPNLYLLVDFSGSGKSYQQVSIYKGAGSSYASVLETAPNEIMVVYDESNFIGRQTTKPLNRIIAVRYKILKIPVSVNTVRKFSQN